MSKSFDNAIGVRDGEDEDPREGAQVSSPIRRSCDWGDPGRPEICPVFALHRKFSLQDVDRIEATCRTGELGCVECKGILADHLVEAFRGFRERREALATQRDVVRERVERGSRDRSPRRARDARSGA